MNVQTSGQVLWGDDGVRALNAADACQLATAAEMMFFNGAPLAHVVAYREHLRMEAIARRNEAFSRRVRGLRPGVRTARLTA